MRNASMYLLITNGLYCLDNITSKKIDIQTNRLIPDAYENVYFINVKVTDTITYTYVISDEGTMQNLCDPLKGIVKYEIKNITLDIIDNKEFDGSHLIENKKFLEDFRLQFLDVDDILEKITRCGPNSLDDIDKIILNDKNRKPAICRIDPIL